MLTGAHQKAGLTLCRSGAAFCRTRAPFCCAGTAFCGTLGGTLERRGCILPRKGLFCRTAVHSAAQGLHSPKESITSFTLLREGCNLLRRRSVCGRGGCTLQHRGRIPLHRGCVLQHGCLDSASEGCIPPRKPATQIGLHVTRLHTTDAYYSRHVANVMGEEDDTDPSEMPIL